MNLSYRYWVGVVGQVGAEKRDVDLARTTQDKTLLLDRKLQCFKLMGLVANADSRFNGEEALWYDGQHFLVTPYDIFQKSQKEVSQGRTRERDEISPISGVHDHHPEAGLAPGVRQLQQRANDLQKGGREYGQLMSIEL